MRGILRGALALYLGLAGASVGCQTARDYSRRADLDVAISRYHTDLRWGRFAQAARYVHPDLQTAFLEDTGRWKKDIEIKELDISEVYDDGAGKAQVVVHLVWIEQSTQTMKERTGTEKWEFDDQRMTWLLTEFAGIEDQSAPSEADSGAPEASTP